MLADSIANQKAGERVIAARGSIYAAFDSLDCGISHEEAIEYIHGSPHFSALGDCRGVALGVVLGFALVAVEADRARNLPLPVVERPPTRNEET